jgi:hypothetical protein
MNGSKVLSFAALVEMVTGFALVAGPAVIVSLLLGSTLPSDGVPICRVAGVALFALGLGSWPGRRGESRSAAFVAMFAYNGLIALYLAHLATFRHVRGLLLWPAVVFHAGVAALLVWSWRSERRTGADRK